MKNNDMFNFDDNEIYSSSNKFQDIVSDSSFITGGSHGKHRYRKHKRGIKGFFNNIGYKLSDWWHSLKKGQKGAIITVTSIVLVIAIAFGVVRIMFDYNYHDITKDPEDLGFENVINSKIINIALFGIDSREKDKFSGLSDSIMILSVNTESKKVKVISVMRDTLVPITYNGKTTYNKINSAYSKGGPELAIKTLNSIFKLDISEYATVNFYGMADIINAVGGIDVTLAKGEINVTGYEYGHQVNFGINGMIQEQCKYMEIDPAPYYIDDSQAGDIHLNGIQAVAYARIRHAANAEGTTDDYGRTDRQRLVMEQLFNKAITLNKSKYVKLAKALIPCSETSLTYSEIMGLAVNVLLKSPTFEQTRVPLKDYQMSSKSVSGIGSCIYYDLDYAAKLIKAFIYDNITPEDYIAQNGVETNDWYKAKSSSGKTSTSSNSSHSSSNTVTSSKDTAYDDNSNSSTSGINDNGDSDTLGDGNSTQNPDDKNNENTNPGDKDDTNVNSDNSDSSSSALGSELPGNTDGDNITGEKGE